MNDLPNFDLMLEHQAIKIQEDRVVPDKQPIEEDECVECGDIYPADELRDGLCDECYQKEAEGEE